MKIHCFARILPSIAFYAAFLIIGLFTASAFAADSDLDTSFGSGGKVTTGNYFEEGGRDVVIQPDGKIIVAGGKTSTFNVQNMAAARYNADGTLDATFGAGGIYVLPSLAGSQIAAGKAVAVDLQPDGKILLAGSGGISSSPNQIYLIVRLNANGTLDTTFGSGGRVIYNLGNNNAYGNLAAMIFDAARTKIYIGGTRAIDINNNVYGYSVTRFNGDGALDTTFNGTGAQTFMIGDSRGLGTILSDIALQPDGKIVAAGGIQYLAANNESIESFGTARINLDGTLDSSFGTNGIVITNFPGSPLFYSAIGSTVSLLPNGKIFLGGVGGSGSGGDLRNFYFAAQLNSDGSADSSFGTNGKVRAEALRINDSVITASGKIIVVGDKNTDFAVGRLNANGTIDTTFGTSGVVQTDFGFTDNPFSVALQTDGKIVAGGGARNPQTSTPGTDYQMISRYTGMPVSNAPRGTWDGGGADNNWSTAANWGTDTVPTSSDNVVFDATSAKNAVIDTPFTVASISISNNYAGTITQTANLTVNSTLTQAGGAFQGSSAALTINGNLMLSGGVFTGGAGLISGGFGAGINQSGGTFSSFGDVELTYFTLSGGTFNAPNGTMTIAADWSHTTGGTFNGGTGTVKFTGYNTYNCINQITINVATTETFNNLTLANSFCNQRYIAAGDTLIVNGDFRIAYGTIAGGRIRPLGTTTIDATNNGYTGSSTVEYLTPNTNFVINNPSSVVNMLPVDLNAVNSTLTSSGAGRINFYAVNLLDGTINQGDGIWNMANYPGYSQSGGIFNGSAAEVLVSNGTGNPLLTNGAFNSGSGKVTGSFRMTGGTMSISGDMDTANLSIEGGVFNAPLGTLSIFQGFSHTSGGTFNARTGTVKTSTDVGVYGVGFDVNAPETFYNLQFNGTNNNANHVIGAGDTLIVNGTLNFNGRGVSGGSIIANGNVVYTNYGGYQNATTLVKFQDTATRTVTFSNDCTSYFQPTLVDNPNIIVNTGCNDTNAFLTWTSLDLRQGVVNAGDSRSGFSGNFTQSGGTFNAGTNALNPSTTISGNFTLSGGVYNAAPFTSFGGNYTHTAGGNFNYDTGTVIFSGIGGTIDVNSSENFNDVRFEQGSTGTTKTISAGDTLIVSGNLDFRTGYVSGGTIEARKSVGISSNQFGGGSTALNFTGAADQIYTNAGGITTSGAWTVNKPNSVAARENNFAPAAPTNLLISGNIGNNAAATLVPLNIVSGNVLQTGNYNHALASLTLSPASSFVNEFGGTITLGGDVVNDGIIRLNGNGAGCQTDSILLRSTNATQRNWNGNGYFFLTDVDVSGQAGTPVITVYSGTNSGSNGANWVFNSSCFVPTAANVSISGSVSNAKGRGIANVRVILTDAQGSSHVVVTNSFGSYKFEEIAAGQTVTVSINSKKFTFADSTRILNVSEDLAEINFTAEER